MGPPTKGPSISRLKPAILSSVLGITSTYARIEKDPISKTTEHLVTGFSFTKMHLDVSLVYRLAWAGARVPKELLARVVQASQSSHDVMNDISVIFSASVLKRYPLRNSHKRSLLKQLINAFEEKAESVSDAIYDTLGEIMSEAEGEHSYRIYLDSRGENIITAIKEHNQQLCYGTTGLSVWQASCDLANLLTQFVDVPESVLELGAGCGLSGLAVSRVHPHSKVTLTDYDSRVLKQLRENVDGVLQGCSRVCVQNLDWCNFKVEDLKELPQLIIAADVVYDLEILPALCSVISKCLYANEGAEAIVASTLRDPTTLCSFRENIASNGIRIVEDFRYHNGAFTFMDGMCCPVETLFPHTSTLDAPTIFFRIAV